MTASTTETNNMRLPLEKATVKISTSSGFKGTGFFITDDGYILTAWHCIHESLVLSTTIIVETFEEETFNKVQIVQEKSIQNQDIAVLKIEHTPPYLSLGLITEAHKGHEVVAIGYPAGNIEGRGIGIYHGRINQLLTNIEAFETTAIEGPGQSGGLIYHLKTQRVIGLVTEIYNNEITKTTGLAVRFNSLFEQWPEIMPLDERLSRCIQKIPKKTNLKPFISRQVTKYLTQLKKKWLNKKNELNEEEEYTLLDIEDLIADNITPEEFIAAWQQDSQSSTPIKYDILAKRLKNNEIALFLGSQIPQQLAPQLEKKLAEQLQSTFELKGCFSEICEYAELNNDYSRNSLRSDIQKLITDHPMPLLDSLYQLLAHLPTPIVIIYSGYDSLLENTFKQHNKTFAVITHSQNNEIIVNCSDQSKPEIFQNHNNLSDLDLLKDGYSLIYKINGCMSSLPNEPNEPDALLLAEHDYFNFAKKMDNLIPNYVIGHLTGRDLWFLGQYPQNWENRLIMHAILERRSSRNNMTLKAIHKEADEFTKTYWEAKNVTHYPIDLAEFVDNLRQYIE
jgi:V8-like Glu-specific endopeptidase